MVIVGAGIWHDAYCWASFPISVVCRRTVGYKLASNGVYYRLVFARTKSHLEARRACQADGAQLANAPYGQQDKQAFGQFAVMLSGLGVYQGILVDGNDWDTEGLWKLPNGRYTEA